METVVEDRKSLSGILSNFKNTTTTHGVPHVAKAKGAVKFVVWVIMTMGCLTGFTYNAYSITRSYIAFQVYVKIDKQQTRIVEFPAISICNTNPLKKTAIASNAELTSLVSGWADQPPSSKRRKKRSTCPNAVEPNSGICFWFEDVVNRKSYAESSTLCASADGVLPIIDTQEKKTHIFTTLGITTKSFWLNLVYDNTAGEWLWNGDTSLSWTDWKSTPASPPSDPTYTCVYISYNSFANSDDEWENLGCDGVVLGTTLYPLYTMCQDYIPSSSETTTMANPTTTVPETTTTAHTTTVPETTTVLQTTTTPQTTTVPETTTILQTTTTPQTTTVPETTTVLQTTTTPQTTTVSETTTTLQTPTISETTISPQTTTVPETTTTPQTTTVPETTTTPQTTTVPHITTVRQTTMVSPTTVPKTTTVTHTTTVTSVSTTTSALSSTTTKYSNTYPERDPPREDFQKESDVLEIVADLSTEDKQKLGYTYTDFVLDCVYNNVQCNSSDFKTYFDAVHGNCYVFNTGWNGSNVLHQASNTGRKYGIELTLNLAQNEYVASIGAKAGAVVVIHQHATMPFPEDEGVFAPPGMLTSIATKRTDVSRLGGDYSDCTYENSNNYEKNAFAEHYGVKYSNQACEKTCYQKYVIETCGCADPQYPTSGRAFGNVQNRVCNARNLTEDDCVYGVTLKYIERELQCDCPLTCETTLYSYTTSRVMWPSEKEKETILNTYNDKIASMIDSSTDPEYYRRNLLKVEVYFEDLSYETMTEHPKYPQIRFVSDLGSIIGLWIGCSLFSILEFVELGFDLARYCCHKSSSRKKLHSNKTDKTLKRSTKITKISNINSEDDTSPIPLKVNSRRFSRNIRRSNSKVTPIQSHSHPSTNTSVSEIILPNDVEVSDTQHMINVTPPYSNSRRLTANRRRSSNNYVL